MYRIRRIRTQLTGERAAPLRESRADPLFVSTIIAANFNRRDVLSELVTHLSSNDLDTLYSDALEPEISKAVAPLKAGYEAVLSGGEATSENSVRRTYLSHDLPTDTTSNDLCLGDTAMHLATRMASDDAVAVLLRAGANSELISVRGERPLDVATCPEHALVWKLLSSARICPKTGTEHQAMTLRSFAERWLSAGNQ